MSVIYPSPIDTYKGPLIKEGEVMTSSSKLLLSLAALLSSLSATFPVQAQHMNAADAPCRGPATGVEQASCLSMAAKEANTALNEAYQRVTAVLTPPARQELQETQRSWLSYRDLTCAAERNLYVGGTGGNAAHPACLEAVTRHRITDLKATYWWKVEKFGG